MAQAGIGTALRAEEFGDRLVGDLCRGIPRGEIDLRQSAETDAGAVRAVGARLGDAEGCGAVFDGAAEVGRGDRLADLLGDGAVAGQRERPALVAGARAQPHDHKLAHLHDPVAEDDRGRQKPLDRRHADLGDGCLMGNGRLPKSWPFVGSCERRIGERRLSGQPFDSSTGLALRAGWVPLVSLYIEK